MVLKLHIQASCKLLTGRFMGVSVRLSRGGSKKRPYYKVVVASSRAPRDGSYLEQIGTYNPLLAKDDENRVRLVEDRVRYWLGVGAQPTDRVARLLDKAGIRERSPSTNPHKGQMGQRAAERAKERALKLEAAAADIMDDYTFSVALLDSNEKAFARLAASAENLMNYFGYMTMARTEHVQQGV